MKNEKDWKPTKFVLSNGRLRASADPGEVGRGSRFAAGLMAAHYQAVIPAHARGHLVDLGCGKVPLYGLYRPCVDAVTCVDWQQRAHIDICQDLNTPLQMADEVADTVLLTDVLEHIFRPDLLFTEIARILKPGGRLIMNTPFYYWLHEQPNDYYRYTRFCLEKFCSENDLEILSLEPVGGMLEIFHDTVAKLAARYRVLSAMHLAFGRSTRRIGFLRAFSARTAELFPLGYILVAGKGRPE